ERLAEAERVGGGPALVVRRLVSAAEGVRLDLDERGRRVAAGVERVRVDDRLERRAGLAVRLRRPIEPAARRLVAPGEGEDVPCADVDRQDGGLGAELQAERNLRDLRV